MGWLKNLELPVTLPFVFQKKRHIITVSMDGVLETSTEQGVSYRVIQYLT